MPVAEHHRTQFVRVLLLAGLSALACNPPAGDAKLGPEDERLLHSLSCVGALAHSLELLESGRASAVAQRLGLVEKPSADMRRLLRRASAEPIDEAGLRAALVRQLGAEIDAAHDLRSAGVRLDLSSSPHLLAGLEDGLDQARRFLTESEARKVEGLLSMARSEAG